MYSFHDKPAQTLNTILRHGCRILLILISSLDVYNVSNKKCDLRSKKKVFESEITLNLLMDVISN